MRILCLVLAGFSLAPPIQNAQSILDLAGSWVALDPLSAAGHELRIRQDQGWLRIEQVRLTGRQVFDDVGKRSPGAPGERERTVYRLDGSAETARLGFETVQSRLIREGERIRLVDLYQSNGMRVERVLYVDDRGRLVLQHRRPTTTGDDPAAASQNILAPSRIVYERKKP